VIQCDRGDCSQIRNRRPMILIFHIRVSEKDYAPAWQYSDAAAGPVARHRNRRDHRGLKESHWLARFWRCERDGPA
jgi:hypothetical protein